VYTSRHCICSWSIGKIFVTLVSNTLGSSNRSDVVRYIHKRNQYNGSKDRTLGRPEKRSIASFERGYIEYPSLMTFPRRDTRKSTSKYVYLRNEGAVGWSSKAQPTVAVSTCEVKYKAAAASVAEAKDYDFES
jgi:hypothetical protein